MRITKTLAVAASGCALVAAVAVPASAHAGSHPASHAAASKVFHTTLSPKSGIHTGTKLTLKGTGAQKSARFSCVLIISKGTKYAIDGASISGATSTKKGAITCHATFKPFSGKIGSTKVSCPTSKANAKAGYKCAFAVSNAAQNDSGISYFTAKK